MKKSLYTSSFVLFLTIIGYGQKKYPLDLPPAEKISIINLIANSQKYDKKIVQVVGYLNIEFEGDAIYLQKEDYENGLTKNAISVDLTDSLAKQKLSAEYSKKYVIIMGTFHNDAEGSLFSGSIRNIVRLDFWRQ